MFPSSQNTLVKVIGNLKERKKEREKGKEGREGKEKEYHLNSNILTD